MKEFIEKLIGRLEDTRWTTIFDTSCIFENDKLDKCIAIVNQLAEEYNNDFCEWKFVKSVVDGGYFYSSGCNHKRFSDLHSFEYCPYCGKKIKVVE